DATFNGTTVSKLSISQPDGYSGLTIGNQTTPRFALNGNQDGSWTTFDYAGSSWASGITQKSGNVGIGTTTPGSYKLAVEGTIGARKLKITQVTPWPDYVFDSSYALTPLAQVEQFIKDNKHLPDVPSSKEVTDKGLDVGDNQAVLLKKIEELTLYMIEMKKENELLKNKNQQLENRIEKIENKK
ncbi:hypothetical protein ACI6Q2_23450, partial [Chitinophagaceae bacterium LWZ2-11]